MEYAGAFGWNKPIGVGLKYEVIRFDLYDY